jgi:hypothetical protein
MFSKSPYSTRNVCIKSVITLFCAFGIFFSIFATLSCRWFVFNHDDESVQDWDFIPHKNNTISIGLFRYQATDINFNDEAEEPFLTTSNIRCSQFDPLFLGRDYDMMFAAQICIILGPILAFVAWLLAMIGVNKHPTGFFLLLATGVQAASVVASMSWCDEFWDCPWLLGSLSNIVATCLFFLGWLLSVCGLVKETPQKQDLVQDTDDEEDHPSVIVTRSQVDSRLEEGSSFSSYDLEKPEAEEKEVKQSAEDLLGTNDPIILRAVSQSAKVVRDLTAKLKQRKQLQAVDEEDSTANPTIAMTKSEEEEGRRRA